MKQEIKDFISKWSNFWRFQPNKSDLNIAFEKELNNLFQPTTQPLSAIDVFKKHGAHYYEDDEQYIIAAMYEYRSQPTPTPEISAEEYAEMMDRDWMIPKTILEHTITALELAGVDATYYKQALEYLKNK